MKAEHINHLQFYFLIIALILSAVFLIIVIGPFLTTLLLAIILVTGTYPLYERLLSALKNRRRFAALLMSLISALLFSGPFILFLALLSQEAVSTYQVVERFFLEGHFNVDEIVEWLSANLRISESDITASITQAAQNLSGFLVAQSTNVLKSVALLIFNFFLLFFSMYFFYKDGPKLVESAKLMIPLPRQYENNIFQKFHDVSLAMLYGIFLTAMVQGLLGGVGLHAAGIENAVFWGTAMGILGMLPIGGTAIVWMPAAIILLVSGHYFAGIGLFLWGALIVAVVDNLIKPLLIQRGTQTYPLATFLVVIGGLIVFGLKGAILSPMILVVFLTLAHLYELEKLHTSS